MKILSIDDIKKKENILSQTNEDIISKAQEIGARQIQEYIGLANKLIEELREKETFERLVNDLLEEQIRTFMIDELLELFIKPIFKGEKPIFMKDEDYLDVRKGMYDEIIKRNKLDKNLELL